MSQMRGFCLASPTASYVIIVSPMGWGRSLGGLTAPQASAIAKGETVAEELARRRILLVLDGVEPLQHGPGHRSDSSGTQVCGRSCVASPHRPRPPKEGLST